MFLIELATETQAINWGTIIVQSLITLGVVFGGAGFWEFLKTKFQAKREDKKEQSTTDTKVDGLSKQVSELSNQFGAISLDLKDIKTDLSLLQEANKATVAYREMRDKKDQEAVKVQEAVIEALKGMMRDRLLETYERCTKKGFYTREERDIYSKLYACYRGAPFDGNSVIKELHDRIIKLPLTEEEAERLKLLGAKKHKDLA